MRNCDNGEDPPQEGLGPFWIDTEWDFNFGLRLYILKLKFLMV